MDLLRGLTLGDSTINRMILEMQTVVRLNGGRSFTMPHLVVWVRFGLGQDLGFLGFRSLVGELSLLFPCNALCSSSRNKNCVCTRARHAYLQPAELKTLTETDLDTTHRHPRCLFRTQFLEIDEHDSRACCTQIPSQHQNQHEFGQHTLQTISRCAPTIKQHHSSTTTHDTKLGQSWVEYINTQTQSRHTLHQGCRV